MTIWGALFSGDVMGRLRGLVCAVLFAGGISALVQGQVPDHPVLTEVYTDPPGANDGPVGRDVGNQHQEYLELYLPPASALNPALNKDALRLTFYEVEGDTSSSGNALVNYRFDLPIFDLDPSNGTTPGAFPRPSGGVVILGWVDYVGDPPTGLAGTPSTRVALINGGVTTSPAGATFVAINGHHFTGTTNFPVLVAESLIDLPDEARSGVIQNGSGAYLLVDRDLPGYVALCDDQHQVGCSADPALADGTILGESCFLDGCAANDDDNFEVTLQPYDPDSGLDLAIVLPSGGVYSLLIPQISEAGGNGYLRRFVDVAKTTEDGTPLKRFGLPGAEVSLMA